MKSFLKSFIIRILAAEAKTVLKKYHPRIVAVTGTVGKTATKDAIAAALSAFFSVRKSEKSFNSEIGVPLTILGLPNGWHNPFIWAGTILRGFLLPFSRRSTLNAKRYPDWLVLEIGADKPGDISSLAHWLCPDVAVITRFAKAPVHIEFFPSVTALLQEKATLIHFAKEKGLIVLGSDDEDIAALQSAARGRRVMCFGTANGAEVCGSHYAVRYGADGFPEGIIFRADSGGISLPLSVSGALGAHYMQPLLAALAVSAGLGLNLVQAAERLSAFEPPRGRMRLLRGKNGSLIIDDSYNSSPVALHEALAALQALTPPAGGGRKIAVLGDMLELGEYASAEHKKGGALAASSCALLFTVGARAEGFASGAREAEMKPEQIIECRDSREAGERISAIIHAGDIVLIKGSQGVRMERAVTALLAEPARASELLVRQEKEWERR